MLKDRKRLNESSWTRKKNVQKGKKVKDIGTATSSLKSPFIAPLLLALQIDQNCNVSHSHMSHTLVDIVITLSLFYWEHLRWRGSGQQKGVRAEESWHGPTFPDTFLLPAPRAFNLASPDQTAFAPRYPLADYLL